MSGWELPAIVIVGIALVLLLFFFTKPEGERASPREAKVVASSTTWVADSPPSVSDMPVPGGPKGLAEIDAFYANELNAIEIKVGDCSNIPYASYDDVTTVMVERLTGRSRHDDGVTAGGNIGMMLSGAAAIASGLKGGKAARALKASFIRRTLREMSDAERGVLRLADLLAELRIIDASVLMMVRVPIVWNDGKCFFESPGYDTAGQRTVLREGLAMLIGGHFGDVSTASELVQTALREALSSQDLAAEYRHLFERYLFGGSRWLTPTEAAQERPSATALRLGTFEGTQQDLFYDRRESLITIAPPGSGKSQAHVIRNLQALRSPAVVLDIKGEVAAQTAQWRQSNVGRVIYFVPTRPDYSMHYNPLDGVGSEPESAWDDARKLADLLVVPQNHGDVYFENRGRDLLTVAILDVALNETEGHRNMGAVLDRIYINDKEFQSWLDHLRGTGVPHLVRQASAWQDMSAPQRDGIFDSARRHMEVWQSGALQQLIDRSDWRPDDIRAQNATLYLCIRLEDVKKYAPVLRVIIGQTVAGLCGGEAEASSPLVTFFLDELPRLGRMDVVEEALDIGRGFGVRLWMFCQNLGQLRAAYPNAEGMVGNCAARCYMDPDDEASEDLSRYLGQRKGLLDGRQKPLAEPTDLKGPAFADKIIVLQRGKPPAKLVRRMAFAERQAAPRVAEPA